MTTTAEADPRPLADRLRPRNLDEFVGQDHLLSPGLPLRRAVEQDQLYSLVLWGPPGTGKTTLAQIVAAQTGHCFYQLSPIFAGLKEIRTTLDAARQTREHGERSLLFVDEVHRFNKSQLDAFLAAVEDGTLTLIGATTENPSFELNPALLSRCRVYVLKALEAEAIYQLLERALRDPERGYGENRVQIATADLERLAAAADGDARRGLTLLELAIETARMAEGELLEVDAATVAAVAGGERRRYDKVGDQHYDLISALHKAIRGSDPDGAVYWLTRMLDGGEEPRYLARRLVRIASEDVGNADPRALPLAISARDAYEFLGSPEGELALAQAAIYLAVAPKSNAVDAAYRAAAQDVQRTGTLEVPLHIRNAPTRLMRELGYGAGYRYDHHSEEGVIPEQSYLPPSLADRIYYAPTDRGLEGRFRERVEALQRRRRRRED